MSRPNPKEARYNCFGYAVGKKRWLVMRTWERFTSGEIDEDEALELAIRELENRYNLKYVPNHKLKENLEYVAYRFSYGDFHFMVRNKKGHWRHKLGNYAATPIEEEKVFSNLWDFGWETYDSPILLFEKV